MTVTSVNRLVSCLDIPVAYRAVVGLRLRCRPSRLTTVSVDSDFQISFICHLGVLQRFTHVKNLGSEAPPQKKKKKRVGFLKKR